MVSGYVSVSNIQRMINKKVTLGFDCQMVTIEWLRKQ